MAGGSTQYVHLPTAAGVVGLGVVLAGATFGWPFRTVGLLLVFLGVGTLAAAAYLLEQDRGG